MTFFEKFKTAFGVAVTNIINTNPRPQISIPPPKADLRKGTASFDENTWTKIDDEFSAETFQRTLTQDPKNTDVVVIKALCDIIAAMDKEHKDKMNEMITMLNLSLSKHKLIALPSKELSLIANTTAVEEITHID